MNTIQLIQEKPWVLDLLNEVSQGKILQFYNGYHWVDCDDCDNPSFGHEKDRYRTIEKLEKLEPWAEELEKHRKNGAVIMCSCKNSYDFKAKLKENGVPIYFHTNRNKYYAKYGPF